MKDRFRRLGLTFIAKKYVAWVAATVLLVTGHISGTDWVLITFAIFALGEYAKKGAANAGTAAPAVG